MKGILISAVFASLAFIANAGESTVVVPTDEDAFVVEASELVRLTGSGIAGSKIEISVEGPAKAESNYHLREVAKGRSRIGNAKTEFLLKPTGKGRVTATITVVPPQPGAKAQETKYVFDVE